MSERAAPISRALTRLKDLVDAGRPLIYIHTPEEARVQQLAQEAAERLFPAPVPVYTWTLTEGLRGPDGAAVPATTEPRAALDHILSYQGAALFVLRDFHDALRDSDEVRRRLRDLYAACLDSGKFILIASPVEYVPDELTRDLVVIDLPLPDLDEMRSIVAEEAQALAQRGIAVDTDAGTIAQLSSALQGLTLNEVRHALRRAVAAAPSLDSSSVKYLLEEKHLLVKKKTGVIEYVADPGGIENVGGAPVLKKWLN